MRKIFLSLKILSIFLFFFIVSPQSAKADDFTTGYRVEYFLNDNQGNIGAKANIAVTLTNQRSDIVIKKISLSFPKTFILRNVKATDNNGSINPDIKFDDMKTTVQLTLNDPAVGKGNTNDINLNFDQDNLFKVNGNVWEVILPTIEDNSKINYEVIVNLPTDSQKKIAISKPVPTEIKGSQIIWSNPQAKTIYAVFGDKQYYQTKLKYHLQNTRLTPVYTDVAFPPDTLYQKIYINSINPIPNKVYVDEDGNFIGRYNLNPKETKDVDFEGTIELFNTPRSEPQTFIRKLFTNDKSYLLTQKSYWQLGSQVPANVGKTPLDVYNFVVNKLSYNYQRVNKDIKRLGALEALQNPTLAVCVEFSDLFIAMAREKGIYSREIQGYGFSNDQQLRPLSLVTDVLHSWPEYFDTQKGIWVQIDPTWQNTSGIDYFSSFDLNHIAFVIHGNRPDYPLPAGTYKIGDTKDVTLTAVSERPSEQVNIQLDQKSFPSQMVDNKLLKTKITIQNNSNVFLYDVPVKIESDNLSVSPQEQNIPVLAPFEKKVIDIQFSSKIRNVKSSANLKISVLGNEVYSGKITIVPYYYELGLKVGYGVIIISILIGAVKITSILKRRKSPSGLQ